MKTTMMVVAAMAFSATASAQAVTWEQQVRAEKEHQLQILTEKNVQGAPALVVEILSAGTRKRDEQIKRHLFDRGGVREYWLVDPELDLIKVYRRTAERRLARAAELAAEDDAVLTTPLLPGFALPLCELFLPT